MYNIALLHKMIHPAYNLFLAIYLAHLLTDFVFQTSRLVSKKRRGDWHGYVIHGVTTTFSFWPLSLSQIHTASQLHPSSWLPFPSRSFIYSWTGPRSLRLSLAYSQTMHSFFCWIKRSTSSLSLELSFSWFTHRSKRLSSR